jgi:starvation-inducible DNA-binding protein
VSPPYDRHARENDLQRELRDLASLAVVGDHLRWVLTGRDAAELVDWLARAGADWRAWADQVAGRLAASGIPPDGRVRSLARDIPYNWVPAGWLSADEGRRLVASRLATVAQRARYRHSQAAGAAADVLGIVASGLQAQRQSREEIDAVYANRLNESAAARAARLRANQHDRSCS